MLSEIIQGDNGTVLDLTIQDDNRVIDITNTTVEVVIKYKDYRILKQAQITDGENGRCKVILGADDIQNDGAYYLQASVVFSDGKSFSSSIHRFNVGKKIGYISNPPPSGGGNGNFSNVTDSTINGNILVNNIEVKVYDDTAIQTSLNGKAGIDDNSITSTTQTWSASKINNALSNISKKEILTVHDTFIGTTSRIYTFTQPIYQFSILNDGNNSLIFAIGDVIIDVKSGEDFEGIFDPFNTVSIYATSSYSAYGEILTLQ